MMSVVTERKDECAIPAVVDVMLMVNFCYRCPSLII